MKLIITCEHGGNDIPDDFLSYFENTKEVLTTHFSYDLGVLDTFNFLKPLADYSNYSTTSRLLIELNRSLHHPKLFSTFTKFLSKGKKTAIINTFYKPYRNAIESKIKEYIGTNQSVIHISIHSFTPILNNIERHCDMGLLFDSSKKAESGFCKQLKNKIKVKNADLNIRYNYPYLGKADGFTTYLRKQFPEKYIGIEIEINQKFSNENIMDIEIKNVLFHAIKEQISTAS